MGAILSKIRSLFTFLNNFGWGAIFSLLLLSGCEKENISDPKVCPDVSVSVNINRNETMVYYGLSISDSVYIIKMILDNYEDTIVVYDNKDGYMGNGYSSYMIEQKYLDFFHGVIRTTIEGNFANDNECSFSKVILTDIVWR
jgi:hypothetical protein